MWNIGFVGKIDHGMVGSQWDSTVKGQKFDIDMNGGYRTWEGDDCALWSGAWHKRTA